MRYNKKIFNKRSLFALAAALMLGSCSKSFVDKTPSTAIPTVQALNSVTALQSDLTALYAEIRNVDQYGRDFPVVGDIQADNTFLETSNSGRYISQFGYTVATTDAVVQGMWSESYTGILQANQIIDAAVTGADDVKAQAYAIRALLYWKLVTIFASPYTADSSAPGVPLVLHFDVAATPGRSSVGTIYNQIVSDLKAALPASPGYSSSIFLSTFAIEGLLARVYMYEGDYTDAQAMASDVIQNGPFTLVPYNSLVSFWANPAVKFDAVEVMFEIDCDAINNNGFDDLGGIYINGYQDIYCSSSLASLYTPTDARFGLLIPGKTKSHANAFIVNKYPNAENSDRDNPKVIRLAEVYLIAAESAARLGDNTDAQAWVNAVAELRDTANKTGYTDVGPALVTDIVQERRKELAFEGDRFYDLNRLGLPIIRGSNGGASSGDGITIPYPDFRRIAPIPLQEILRNSVIASQQNPGY
jgi:hypothetical protein